MKRLVIAVVAATTLWMTPPASAETLSFCFEEWEPFHFMENGKARGIQTELNAIAMAAMGHTATYEELPYVRCREGVKQGKYAAMLLTSGIEDMVPTSVPTVMWEVGIIARPDWPVDRFSSLSEFDGASVGLVNGYEYPLQIEEAKAKWQVQMAADAILNLRKAAAGRIDMTIDDIPWAVRKAKNESLTLKILSPTLFSDPQFTYFAVGNEAMAGALSREMKRLIDDGTVDRLYQEYLGVTYTDVQARAANALMN